MKRMRRIVIARSKKSEFMTDLEARVLAIYIDTEGSICAGPSRDYYVPAVKFGMASLIPVEMVKKWGGRIYKYKKPGERRIYVWEWQFSQLSPLLQKIKGHLNIKRKQAEVAIQMVNILTAKSGDWKTSLIQCAEEMRKLNEWEPPDIRRIKEVDF